MEIKDQKHDLKEAWVYKSLTLIYRAMLFGRVVGICAFFPFLGNPLLTYFRFLFGTVRPFALWFCTYTSSISTNYIYFFRKERGSASYVNGCITSGGVLRAVKRHSKLMPFTNRWLFILDTYQYCIGVCKNRCICTVSLMLKTYDDSRTTGQGQGSLIVDASRVRVAACDCE